MRIVFLAFFVFFTYEYIHAYKGGFRDAMEVSTSGLKVQAKRLSIISQNIANSDSTGTVPGATPYRRKIMYLNFSKDRAKNLEMARIKKIDRDPTPFKVRFEPDHPAANDQGYVLYPNVDKTLENMDAREAQRSYEANMGIYEISKNLEVKTIDILR